MRVKALITGSGGLVGSACARLLSDAGWEVVGVDNNMRQEFFGPQASIAPNIKFLQESFVQYRHRAVDIRDRQAIRNLVRQEHPDFIIHAAAQPSHDRATSIPYEDFDVNAVGTLNLLVAARDFCRDAPFCFLSTNKVYGDRPNSLPLVEQSLRYDYADGRDGINESMSIDASLHSVFGASKVAADVMSQEFGRHFQMPVGVFRGGCITGPQHAAVQLHGYLAYIVECAVTGREYTIFGYKGKQVRDQIHCNDVARLLLEFFGSPRCGEVYNLGGGRQNSISILETVELLAAMGLTVRYRYDPENRMGDHICYITDLGKVRSHFPNWELKYSLYQMIAEIVEARSKSKPHDLETLAANDRQ
ncbi:MAG TPA: NAD-dependent epimerase/dehydratase family protein [Terriglobia bacterium]|nr:NAD-dependent epimerase/dehydratase family protein [Terriglobia bacterium]